MKEKTFKEFIRKQFYNKTLKQKLDVIEKESKWINEIWEELEKESESYIQCEHCENYFKKEEYKSSYERVTSCEVTYTDCGYGDDDMYGDVTRLVQKLECPKCGKITEGDKHWLSTTNERRRR